MAFQEEDDDVDVYDSFEALEIAACMNGSPASLLQPLPITSNLGLSKVPPLLTPSPPLSPPVIGVTELVEIKDRAQPHPDESTSPNDSKDKEESSNHRKALQNSSHATHKRRLPSRSTSGTDVSYIEATNKKRIVETMAKERAHAITAAFRLERRGVVMSRCHDLQVELIYCLWENGLCLLQTCML